MHIVANLSRYLGKVNGEKREVGMKKRPFFRMVSALAAIWVLAQSEGVLAYSVRQSTIESEDDSRLTSLH